MKPVIANDATFAAEVLASPVPVLVDFWAPWCAPCQIVAPVLEEIAAEFAGRIKVVKVNTDENAIARQYNIMSIPTLMLFRNGQVLDRMVGALPKQQLVAKLNYFTQGASVLN